MSTPTQIQTQILAILAAATELTTTRGVKKFFNGLRAGVSDSDYPFICVEPLSNEETRNTVQTRVDIKGTYEIWAAVFVQNTDIDTQVAAVTDLENSIKKVLSADHTLGGYGNVYDVNFGKTDYIVKEWPVRYAVIELIVDYRQLYVERT